MTQSRSLAAALEVDGSRYQIERKLGEGSAGAVYLARDRETGDRVALKKLFRMDAKSVLRLKREFRSLVDVAHPNLVKLYDMGRTDDCWFLTMEYLEGVDLTNHLITSKPSDGSSAALRLASANDRLVSAFRELAQPIRALHLAGLLHRDLKPSNVLVVNGRVVVLDFGLVRELNAQAATVTEEGSISGTPAYMAPEQIRGAELDAASDWYAFGVILYEALCGSLPFDGTLVEIFARKLDAEPVAVHERAAGVPRWLGDLCMTLLRREPATRPTGDEVLAAFEVGQASSVMELPRTATEKLLPTEGNAQAHSLFGRHAELAALRGALHESERGRTVVAHVRGLSGTGKSSLVERFLDELESERAAAPLVLRSRCYELEQMPFKALDGVLDALVRHLAHLTDLEVAQVLPHELGALSQLFPVLGRLPAVKRLTSNTKPFRDAVTERQRAEFALRQLFDRLATRGPIVLWIDDLQWGDLDSARILRSWMQEPVPSPLLLVFSYRSDESATSSCLASLLERDSTLQAEPAAECLVELSQLRSDDMRALCEERLGGVAGATAELVTRIAAEAHGSPFLASQLTALAQAKLARGDTDVQALSLDALVSQTAQLVPEDARRLLEVLAVAGRPMLPKLVFQVAGAPRNGRALVHALRRLNLVRTRDIAGTRMLEVYHDRVRERVSEALSEDERVAINTALLRALAFGVHEPDWLMSLALGANQPDDALNYGMAAAERANASLAFEREAELYQRCLELAPSALAPKLWLDLAQAWVRCGRGVEAAQAYSEASKGVPREQALQCVLLAAAHSMRCGHLERAEPLMREVLQAIDAPLPKSDAAVRAAITWERARLTLRGFGYRLRADAAPGEISIERDTLYALGGGLAQYDNLRATLLNTRELRRALDAGEPLRLSRAFCLVAMHTAVEGDVAQARPKIDAALGRAALLAEPLSERARAGVHVARAFCASMLGESPSVVLTASLEAERMLRLAPRDSFGEYFALQLLAGVRLAARCDKGEVRAAADELDLLVREAHANEHRSLLLGLAHLQVFMDIVQERTANSLPRLDEQALELPSDRFGSAHAIHLFAVSLAGSATGAYTWAHTHLDAVRKRWLRSPFRHSALIALGVNGLRASMLINQAFAEGRPADAASWVRHDLDALHRNPLAQHGWMQAIEARLAYARGDRERATLLWRAAIEACNASGRQLEATRGHFALGALIGGAEGAAQQMAALERLREFGFVNPWLDVRINTPELT